MPPTSRATWASLAAVFAATAALALTPATARAALASQCIGRSTAVTQNVPWAQQELQPSRVWGITGGGGVTVAVLDSGVSATVPALSGAVLPGLDVLDRQPADTDCLGHGTFTAGIIAARPVPGDSFAGVAPQARILPVNVVGASGSATSAAVASGISYAVTHGATVVDISVNTTPGPSAALAAAVASAVASNVVVIAPVSVSATNQANEVSYPAAYPGVIAVSAVDSSGTPVASAGKGVRVDLAAPGAQVLSIGPSGPGLLTGDGAAVATAFVAGSAALVRSYYPQLSAAQVVHRLEVTADQPGTALPNAQVGYGIVDPYTAVTTVLPEESGGLPPPAQAARAPLLPPSAAPDTWPAIAALLVCTLTAAAIAAAVTAVHVVRHGRRRGWRPPPARSARHQR